MIKTKYITFVFWFIVTILPIFGIVWGIMNPEGFSESREIWQNRVTAFGVLAPLAFVAVQALQVVFTPISHYSIGVVGGFLYGPWFGGLLNYIGRIIGHLIAFFIARSLGRKIAEKYVSSKTLDRYDKYVSNKSLILFLMYYLPVFPDDELSYLAGLSKMKFKMFFLANIFGHLGGSIGLAYIGSGVNTKDPLFWILMISVLVGFPLIWWLMKQRETEFRNEPVAFLESSEVKEGVICDVYSFIGDDTKDLGIVKVKKGFKTPLQLVVKGEKTLQIFKEGKGALTIIDRNGAQKVYSFPNGSRVEVEVKIGEKMQWEAQENLVFAEVCYPPYKEGRFENM